MDQEQLFVKMALHTWNNQLARAEKLFNSYSEAEFLKPVAPGKNRIIYLYGHLATYHDALKETLGLGKRSKPEYAALFLQNPDDAITTYPDYAELKKYWAEVHKELSTIFELLPAGDWFKKHATMTDDDFVKDPSRNRLNVVLNRTNHLAYHLGQVMLVKPENN